MLRWLLFFGLLCLAYPQGIASPDEDELLLEEADLPVEEAPIEEEEIQEDIDIVEPEDELPEESTPLIEEDLHPIEEEGIEVFEGDIEEGIPETARPSTSRDTQPSQPQDSSLAAVADTTAEAFSWLPRPSPLPLRLIDSPLNPNLTTDKRVNQKIRTTSPFLVQIARPRLLNLKGYALRHGFEQWYLYIIVAGEIRIAGKPLRCQGLPTYIAIVSPLRKLQELPPVLETPALMLKGIVDYGDTIVHHFYAEARRLRAQLDSLKALPPPPDEIQAQNLQELLQKTQDSLVYAEVYRNLYCHFQKAKTSPKKIVKFFLSFPFNRTLTYSIYSAPYALPRYLPPENSSPSTASPHLSQE
ncbi:MAG: hypothetical protein NZ580_03070 [Bacteroidia bacterium]|nr:hypothetical protein [Bacteroidia bacterium]MDW8235313.1 hypothetical protein [Bacteroidia bacterium]